MKYSVNAFEGFVRPLIYKNGQSPGLKSQVTAFNSREYSVHAHFTTGYKLKMTSAFSNVPSILDTGRKAL